MASVDVKTAFVVTRPSVVSTILTRTETHGQLVAALLAEMKDVRGSACFEYGETEFRHDEYLFRGMLWADNC